MKHSFIILDDDAESVLKTLAVASRFQNLHFLGSASSYDEGLNLILELKPTFVFLEIDPSNRESNLSLLLINELHRFLTKVPKIIITTKNKELAFEAIQYEVLDYLKKPIDGNELRKTLLKFEKGNSKDPQNHSELNSGTLELDSDNNANNYTLPVTTNETETVHETTESGSVILEKPDNLLEEATTVETLEDEQPIKTINTKTEPLAEEKPLIICVKSYGDYRFIEAKDICYLQADNNSTDIHLYNGEMITAFKTLKHFENVLSIPFVRIHNSYIVNIDYVSRIHTGNSVCYIKNTTTKLPFSKSYKENVDAIINSITNGNYLEI